MRSTASRRMGNPKVLPAPSGKAVTQEPQAAVGKTSACALIRHARQRRKPNGRRRALRFAVVPSADSLRTRHGSGPAVAPCLLKGVYPLERAGLCL